MKSHETPNTVYEQITPGSLIYDLCLCDIYLIIAKRFINTVSRYNHLEFFGLGLHRKEIKRFNRDLNEKVCSLTK